MILAASQLEKESIWETETSVMARKLLASRLGQSLEATLDVASGYTRDLYRTKLLAPQEERLIPDENPDDIMAGIQAFATRELLPEMRRVTPEANITFREKTRYPGLFTPPDADVVNFVKGLLGADTTDKVSFGTEGGLFSQQLQIPAVVCGPGSILQAHKADEYVAIDQLTRCERMLDKLRVSLGGSDPV